MQVKYFVVCEQAVKRADGSMDALRFGIQNVGVKRLPMGLPGWFLVGIRCDPSDHGDFPAKMTLMDADGKATAQVDFVVNFPAAGGFWKADGALPLFFAKDGMHALVLTIQGRGEVARWEMQVRLNAPTPPAA